MKPHFYDFSASTLGEEHISMNSYRGQVVLVVNTASECGFTPQLEGLQKLYVKYKEHGFVILGFPCNQFGNQEPGEEKDIAKGCVLDYGVKFPMFSKIDVKGADAHPLFKHLKQELGGILGSRIKWNFTKFLLDRQGNPVRRFAPITKPENLEAHIEKLL